MKKLLIKLILLVFISTIFFHPVISKAGVSKERLLIVQMDGKYGYINQTGQQVIKAQFDDAKPFSDEGLAVVGIKKELDEIKYGVINQKGNYVVAPKYGYIGRFSEGLAVVEIETMQDEIPERKYGYINTAGKEVIKINFDYAQGFLNNYACVAVGKNYGFIDKNGNFVIKPTLGNGDVNLGAQGFYHNYMIISGVTPYRDKKTYKWGLMDIKGKILVKPVYFYITNFSDGTAAAVKDDFSYDIIDKNGSILFKPKGKFNFFNAELWEVSSDGLIAVSNESGKYGYIDKKGKFVIQPQFSEARAFKSGIAIVATGQYPNIQYRYINKKGKFISKIPFVEAHEFSEGVALVATGSYTNRKYGYIDLNGEFAVTPQFEDAADFKGGIARVSVNGLWRYINQEGTQAFQPQFSKCGDFENGVATVELEDGKLGYIDLWGRYIWNPTK